MKNIKKEGSPSEWLSQPEDPVDAEAFLKRIEKKDEARQGITEAHKNLNFKDALKEKLWRTGDGRYLSFQAMTDTHLLNAYHTLGNSLDKYFKKLSLGEVDIQQLLKNVRERGVSGKYTMTAEATAYHYLYLEITNRNLFDKKITESVDAAFDLLNTLINNSSDE